MEYLVTGVTPEERRQLTAPDICPNPLPCPFCGGENHGEGDEWTDDGEFALVVCGDCKATAPAAQWNNRVTGQGAG